MMEASFKVFRELLEKSLMADTQAELDMYNDQIGKIPFWMTEDV